MSNGFSITFAVTYPVFPSDVAHTSDGYIRHLERLEIGLGFVVPDLDLTVAGVEVMSTCLKINCNRDILETTDDMRLRRVEVHRLDTIRTCQELPLYRSRGQES